MWNRKMIKRIIALVAAMLLIFSQTAFAASGYEKNETVRVRIAPSGKVRKIKVEDWLKIRTNSKKIKDRSSLKGIINRDGDEEFKRNGKTLVWENKNEDITYQGTSKKALPVDVKISYYLDGRRVSAGEIAGKSGHVKIRFDYDNNALVNVDGRRVHVPFLCATGMMLPKDVFTKVRVSNGKIMESSSQTTVLGIAAPSVKEELNLPSGMSELPLYDWFEVEAEAKKFELEFTATVVSTVGLDEMDEVNDLKGLSSALSSFTGAANKLSQGSGELSAAMHTMNGYLTSYFNGVRNLDSSIGKLNSSLKTMTSQKKALETQLDNIQNRLKKYEDILEKAKNDEESEEVEKLVKKIIVETRSSYEYLEDVKKKLDRLDGFIERTREFKSAVESYRDSLKTDISAIDTTTVMEKTGEMEELINGMDDLTEDQKKMLLEKNEEISSAAQSAETSKQKALQDADALYPDLEIPDFDGIDTQQLSDIIDTLKKEQALLDKYDSYLKKYSSSEELILDMEKNVKALKDLTKTVQTAMGSIDELYRGTRMMKKGSGTLVQMNPNLKDGINALDLGMNRLDAGVIAFSKGAEKMSGIGGGNLSGSIDRFNTLRRAERYYTNYSGIEKGVKGSVVFIYESDEIEAQ